MDAFIYKALVAKAKLLLGIKDESKDDILAFCFELTSDEIKNYCNIKEIPAELHNVMVNIVVDNYRQSGYGAEQMKAEIKSTSRGDTSHSFKTPSDRLNESIKNKTLLHDYRTQLSCFRKVRW